MQYIRKANYAAFMFEITLADGSMEDLSDTTLTFIVKKNKSDADTDAVLSDSIVNSDTNIVLFQFDATQTSNLDEGDYYVALKAFKPSNLNYEIWSDKLKITKETFNG